MARQPIWAAAALLALALPAALAQLSPDASLTGMGMMSLDPAAEPAAMAAAAATANPVLDFATQVAQWDAQARAAAVSAANKPALLLMGDSITGFGSLPYGWTSKLQGLYGSSAEVVNAGVGMGNTRSFNGGWYTVEAGRKWFGLGAEFNRIKLVTVCFGANDASVSVRNISERWIPVPEYKSNLISGVKDLLKRNLTNVLLITPPPPVTPPRVDRNLAVTAEYVEAMQEVGAQFKLPVLDLFTALQNVPDWRMNAILPDGLHLTPSGQDVMLKLVLGGIRRFYPQVAPGVLGRTVSA